MFINVYREGAFVSRAGLPQAVLKKKKSFLSSVCQNVDKRMEILLIKI